ncbi:MAG: hypothetical protein WDN45_13380 [Caulobacteraceae bacterium]
MVLMGSAAFMMSRFSLDMNATPLIVSAIVQGPGATSMIFVPLTTLAFASLSPIFRAEGSSVFTPGAQPGLVGGHLHRGGPADQQRRGGAQRPRPPLRARRPDPVAAAPGPQPLPPPPAPPPSMARSPARRRWSPTSTTSS